MAGNEAGNVRRCRVCFHMQAGRYLRLVYLPSNAVMHVSHERAALQCNVTTVWVTFYEKKHRGVEARYDDDETVSDVRLLYQVPSVQLHMQALKLPDFAHDPAFWRLARQVEGQVL